MKNEWLVLNGRTCYRNGASFTTLTRDRGDEHTPIVTRDADWIVSYHRPDGSCASGNSPHHRDIIWKDDFNKNYRAEGHVK
jgi:hypothetical protein